MSEVLPVAMVISSSGKRRRRSRSNGGRRKIAAVAPVPSRTRPTSPLVNRARPSSSEATAPSIRAAWSSNSPPAAVGVARRPTRSSNRTPNRFSSWPICWLIAGCVRLRWAGRGGKRAQPHDIREGVDVIEVQSAHGKFSLMVFIR
jgi:hypothetical protein